MEIFSTASVENTNNQTNETFPNEVYGEEKDVKEIVVFLLLGINSHYLCYRDKYW